MASIGYQLHGHTVAALCLTECSSCTWCATGFSWTLTVTRCLKIGLMRVDQCVHTQLTQVYVARCMGGSNIQPLWRVRGSHPHTQCNTFRRLVNADAQASMTQTCICTCDETSKITRRISGHHQLHARHSHGRFPFRENVKHFPPGGSGMHGVTASMDSIEHKHTNIARSSGTLPRSNTGFFSVNCKRRCTHGQQTLREAVAHYPVRTRASFQ
jgi:hypothetical protein